MKSEVCVYDMQTGRVSVVLATDRLVEAPNWDGRAQSLIVNADGRLYRVPFDAPDLVPVETGFATRLNNDHGISPDGELLAISDKTETGESRVYVLPATGGEPRLVTPEGPAYWHGWSPDGGTLAYVAGRGDSFQVYACPVEGGVERQVTEGFDHCDGPDYSDDGKWLWFNGEVDGRVDLWRVPAEGGSPERMTDDALVNWFPHPRPGHSEVLYLAYPEGTEGHPRDRDVALRLLDVFDGSVRTLVELWGGQGTINVPCWSPDGAAFAFVRYERTP